MVKKIKVLIAEDNDSIANLYGTYLESSGDFQVERSSNGEQTLSDIEKFKPDILLLDIMMPKKSGFEVLEELRSDPKTSELPVITFTALNQTENKQRAEKLGVSDYLIKSQATIADVVDSINKIMG